MSTDDTIVGLSSGSLPSGIAVVRISGPETENLLWCHGIRELVPRKAILANIVSSASNEDLDRCLYLWFPAPNSFTGEDCAELHLHGGKAVVAAILDSLTSFENTRLAEAGEFSRRAFENGKFDLTEIEGLSDLLAAQTEAQRRQALSQSSGALREIYDGWRERLISILAMMEAEIDFVEEDDVPEDAGSSVTEQLEVLIQDLKSHLDDSRAGEIVRDGFRVVLMGPPNAGKSTLLNFLAERDVAIVTEEAGTTRDVLDVHLDVGGYEVIFSDTAGIRETGSIVEQEGIRRALYRGQTSDMTVWLVAAESQEDQTGIPEADHTITLFSKDDQGLKPEGISVSAHTGHGIDWLLGEIRNRIDLRVNENESGLISRARHREHLGRCLNSLQHVLVEENVEIKAELGRSAALALGRVTGRIDVEELLDVIFSEFCVGK